MTKGNIEDFKDLVMWLFTNPIVGTVFSNCVLGFIIVVTFIQFSNLPWKPWTALFHAVSKIMTRSLATENDEQNKAIKELADDVQKVSGSLDKVLSALSDHSVEIDQISDSISNLRVVFDDFKEQTKDHEELKRAEDARRRILRFDDELRNHVEHSLEFFNDVFDDIDYYERYCVDHPDYKNTKAVAAISHIKAVYSKLENSNGFLQVKQEDHK